MIKTEILQRTLKLEIITGWKNLTNVLYRLIDENMRKTLDYRIMINMTQTRFLPAKSIFSLLKKSNSNLSGDHKIDSKLNFFRTLIVIISMVWSRQPSITLKCKQCRLKELNLLVMWWEVLISPIAIVEWKKMFFFSLFISI